MNHTSTKMVALAAIATIGLSAIAPDADARRIKREKCYGVAKAGQNDCGSADGAHGCAGAAAKDGDVNEWIFLPKGTCERIVGGTLIPGGKK